MNNQIETTLMSSNTNLNIVAQTFSPTNNVNSC